MSEGRKEENRSLENVLLGMWQAVNYQGKEDWVAKCPAGIRVWVFVGTSGSKFLQPSSASLGVSKVGTEGQGVRASGCRLNHRHSSIRIPLRVYMVSPAWTLHFLANCCLSFRFHVICYLIWKAPLTFQLIKPWSAWAALFSAPTASYIAPLQLVSAAVKLFTWLYFLLDYKF